MLNMKTYQKILLVIAAAVAAVYIFGCHGKPKDYYTDEAGTRPTIPQLINWYEQLNAQYFYGSLPEDKTEIKFMDSDSNIASLEQYADGHWGILLDRKTNPVEKMAEFSIAHESCHQYDRLQQLDEGLDQHSGNFDLCMQRLAAQGAFHHLW
jgi:hypothetical protein